MPAVRGLAAHADPAVRRAAYDAEVDGVARRRRRVRGGDERDQGRGRRRRPAAAVGLPRRRLAVRQRRQPADVRRDAGGRRRRARRLPPLAARQGPPARPRRCAAVVGPRRAVAGRRPRRVVGRRRGDRPRRVRAATTTGLGGLVDRALDDRWIDAEPRDGKRGGAFCMAVAGDRSLVLLNWTGGADSTRTVGPRARPRVPQHDARRPHAAAAAAADGAGRDGEHLLRDARRRRRPAPRRRGTTRLALLDVDLQAATQVVVDIRSRFLFEQAVFARRRRRALGVGELDELMLAAQDEAYGDGLDQATALRADVDRQAALLRQPLLQLAVHVRPAVRPRPVRRYRDDPDRFRGGYEDLLSRAGMDTAEELGAGVRPRRHRRGVLAGQPRRAARPHRRVRAAGRRARAAP